MAWQRDSRRTHKRWIGGQRCWLSRETRQQQEQQRRRQQPRQPANRQIGRAIGRTAHHRLGMYVIYPADELLRIYENPDRDPSPVLTGDRRPSCQVTVIAVNERNDRPLAPSWLDSSKKWKERRKERGQTRRRKASRNEAPRSHEVAKGTRREQHARTMQNSRVGAGEDAANPFKDLIQPGLSEPLKQHNAAALKLVQTGECFSSIASFFAFFFFYGLLMGSYGIMARGYLRTRILDSWGRLTVNLYAQLCNFMG